MNKRRSKKILLIGGCNKAAAMATSLIAQGYQVSAINASYEDCLRLIEIKGLTVIHGNGTKPHVLDEAEASEFDIAIALTGKDTDNLVACQLCKKQYGVPKTVSLVSDPNKTAFFSQMGVDSVVCAVSAIANIVQQQAFIDEMATIVPIGMGRVQIIEVQIDSQSPVTGKKLWEISIPQQSIVGCILRGDSTLIPRGDTRVLAGDTLVVLTGSGREYETVQTLTGGY